MTEKRHGSKENLNWKINYLAAQVGEKTHMKTAKVAASRARHGNHQDTETLKQELQAARKLKLESKLYQVRKELKTVLKRAKATETQKQIKKIKSTRKALEETDDKLKKKPTAQDLERYEKELEWIKTLELDALVDKTIKSKLQKNNKLKSEPLIQACIEQLPSNSAPHLQTIESRLISNSAVSSEIASMIHAFEAIMFGDQEKIVKRKAEEEKRKKAEEERKRKAEEKQKVQPKRAKTGESEFMETLDGGKDDNSSSDEDEAFQAIYEGKKKPNRAGQQQRRKKWEEMYGREANHIASAYKKREEKRLADPNYRPKKKPTPKPKPTTPAKSTVAEPVHPSWEAKRLQEEMMSKALSGKAPAANNKIVFDDSE